MNDRTICNNNIKKHALILGGGLNHIFMIKAIRSAGYKITLVDMDAEAPGKEYANNFIRASTFDYQESIEQLLRISKQSIFTHAYTASSGPPVKTLAAICDILNIPCFSKDAALLDTSKIVFRNRFPFISYLVHPEGEISKIKLPAIIKADYTNTGKNTVKIAVNKEQLQCLSRDTAKVSFNGLALVEEYVRGNDYIFCYMVKDRVKHFLGLIAEVNLFPTNGGSGRALALISPAIVTNNTYRRVNKLIDTIIEEYEIENAPITFSVRIDKTGNIIPIEIHLDFGGESVFDWLLKPYFSQGIHALFSDNEGISGFNGNATCPDCSNALIYANNEQEKCFTESFLEYYSLKYYYENAYYVKGPTEKVWGIINKLRGNNNELQ